MTNFFKLSLTPKVSDNGNYLYIFVNPDFNTNLWYYSHLKGNPINTSMNLIPVIDKPEASYEYVTNDGPITYVITQKSAPNYKLVSIDINNPKEVYFKFLTIFRIKSYL